MTARQVYRPTDEQWKPAFEAREQRLCRQQAYPGRCQLDRQRQPIKTRADRRDGRCIDCRDGEVDLDRARPVDEQPHRLVPAELIVGRHRLPRQRERWDRDVVFAIDTQQRPARHQDLEPASARQQLGDQRRGLEHLLEVVEHQQEVPVVQEALQGVEERAVAGLAKAECLGDR